MKSLQNLTFSLRNINKECKTTLHPGPNRSLLFYGYAFIPLLTFFFVKFVYFWVHLFFIYRVSVIFQLFIWHPDSIQQRKSANRHTIQVYPHISNSRKACLDFKDGYFNDSGSSKTRFSQYFQAVSYKYY